MKEQQEIKVKNLLFEILLKEIPQKPNETILQHNIRLLNLTSEIFKIFTKLYER